MDIRLWENGEITDLTDRDHVVVLDGDGRGQPVDENKPPAKDTVNLEDFGHVKDVNVKIVVPHERVGDVRVTLKHRDVEVVIVDQVCGDHVDFRCTTLDDEAELNFRDHCEDGLCHAYQPSNPLDAFDEMEAGGEWTLTIEDLESGHVGVFESWQLEVDVTASQEDDNMPDIDGDAIVWYSSGRVGILYDNGQERVRITADVSGTDQYPSIADGLIVREARVGNNPQIFSWRDGEVEQLTNDDYSNVCPSTDGQSIVWYTSNAPPEAQGVWPMDAGRRRAAHC